MAVFSGSQSADTITPAFVSSVVSREPAGSKPSAAMDTIHGLGGNDIIDGGGGADTIDSGDGHDTISATAGGGTTHAGGGDDEITITHDLEWRTSAAEPDDLAVGQDAHYEFDGVALSVTGEPETEVVAASGIIQDPGSGAPPGPHNFATTGTLVFGQDPANAPGGGFGQDMPLWDADQFGLLRADFNDPTDFVSIDFAFDDDDVGSLKAFAANGALLEEVSGSGSGPEIFTGTIARDTADISYITAGGVASEALYLDNLRYNHSVETDSVSGTFYGDDGNDQITFSSWQQNGGTPVGTLTLHGGAGNDTIASDGSGLSNFDGLTINVYGEAGNDRLVALSVTTFSAFDALDGGNNPDNLYGGPGDDSYLVREAKDVVIERPGEGYDTVEIDVSPGGFGRYVLGANIERLVVGEPSTWGEEGCELVGNALNNTITASGDDDTLYGKPLGLAQGSNTDADTIHGGAGNDLIYGGGGDADTWDGNDSLYGDDGNDRIFGSFGDDAMYGGTGNDEMGGQAGNDTMYGDAGIDKLGGGTGNDVLHGGTEADTLSGRDGLDKLYGEAGNDIFDFDYVADSKPGASLRDLIYDFAGIGPAAGDRIDLATIDANTGAGGNQAFAFKGTAAFTAPGQVRVQAISGSTDTLIQANVTGASGAELEIQVKDGAALPTAWNGADFIL